MNKTILSTSLTFFISLLILGGCSNMQFGNKSFDDYVSLEDVYVPVDVMPQFPGGDLKLHEWIVNNIKYPQDALDQKIQGRVVVRFIVDSVGVIQQPDIRVSAGEILDTEAIRMVNTMPKWIPARKNGNPVSVDYNLPIIFTLPRQYK